MPTALSRPTTIRDSTGTMACSGLFTPSCSAHAVRRSSKVVTSGSTMSSAHASAISVMFSASRSCFLIGRSEERRVGKECRSRWSPDQEKKKVVVLKEGEYIVGLQLAAAVEEGELVYEGHSG